MKHIQTVSMNSLVSYYMMTICVLNALSNYQSVTENVSLFLSANRRTRSVTSMKRKILKASSLIW